LKIRKNSDYSKELGIELFSNDLFEFSLINLESPGFGIDAKIGATIKKYLLSWFRKNNKVLFFIASNEENKARKRIIAFMRWYNTIPDKQREKFEFNIQTFSDGTEDIYIGFLFRKDYKHYNNFKLQISNIINKVESSKTD
jgi:hypothetical protein